MLIIEKKLEELKARKAVVVDGTNLDWAYAIVEYNEEAEADITIYKDYKALDKVYWALTSDDYPVDWVVMPCTVLVYTDENGEIQPYPELTVDGDTQIYADTYDTIDLCEGMRGDILEACQAYIGREVEDSDLEDLAEEIGQELYQYSEAGHSNRSIVSEDYGDSLVYRISIDRAFDTVGTYWGIDVTFEPVSVEDDECTYRVAEVNDFYY